MGMDHGSWPGLFKWLHRVSERFYPTETAHTFNVVFVFCIVYLLYTTVPKDFAEAWENLKQIPELVNESKKQRQSNADLFANQRQFQIDTDYRLSELEKGFNEQSAQRAMLAKAISNQARFEIDTHQRLTELENGVRSNRNFREHVSVRISKTLSRVRELEGNDRIHERELASLRQHLSTRGNQQQAANPARLTPLN